MPVRHRHDVDRADGADVHRGTALGARGQLHRLHHGSELARHGGEHADPPHGVVHRRSLADLPGSCSAHGRRHWTCPPPRDDHGLIGPTQFPRPRRRRPRGGGARRVLERHRSRRRLLVWNDDVDHRHDRAGRRDRHRAHRRPTSTPRRRAGSSPSKTAGPFPLDRQFDRRDITERHAGPTAPARAARRRRPLRAGAGAAVEIWHCDATGDYSAFARRRGRQGRRARAPRSCAARSRPRADGIVEFATIYPGWYRGRAVHIHLRVHRGGATVLTSQLFFPDDYTDARVPGRSLRPVRDPGHDQRAGLASRATRRPTGRMLAVRDADTGRGVGHARRS